MRRDERTQKYITHGYFPPTATEEDIAAAFGGGYYRAQLLVPDGSGLQNIKRQREFELIGEYRKPVEMPGIGGAKPAANGAPTAAPVAVAAAVPQVNEILSAGVLQLFQASATQQQMMMQMFQQAMLLANRPGPDFTAILTAVTPLVTEFLKRPKEERDPLDMLRAVGEIVKQNVGANSNIADTLSAIRDLVELRNDLAPENNNRGTGDPLMDSLPKLAEVVYEGWQQRKAQGAIPPMTATPPQIPATTATPNPPTTDGAAPPQMEVPLSVLVIRREGPRLVQQAAAGRSPALVAGMAIEFAPANVKGALEEFFHRDTEVVAQELVNELPALAQYPNWTADFIAEVQDILFPGEYTDDETEDAAEEQTRGD